ncbi:MAG: SRPBCC family protein [Chitinophagaceae bacterium]|nr:SRPBCC family protein [Chitinophagaceae bacterium]
MKTMRLLFFFILAVIVITAALSFLLPTSQKIERSEIINAPAKIIYQYLVKLENFNKFSVWSQQDSAAIYTINGTDGTVGAYSSWTGSPEISGEGKIEITALEQDRKVEHKLHFTQPKEGNASSVFTLNENNGLTTITWSFEMATPRPWNIFNLFYSMDKQMGKDFEQGLATLKSSVEQLAGTTGNNNYEVLTMDFPSTTFALIRQQVKWSDIHSFQTQHLPIIRNEAMKANASPGTASGLFYNWDEKNQLTDMAAALPVKKGAGLNNTIIKTEYLPAGKAVYVNYYGSYEKAANTFSSIQAYLDKHKLKQKFPVIQQYITGPASEKDTAKWLTKIVFLVE